MSIRRLSWHFLRRIRIRGTSLAYVKHSRRRYNFASSIRSIVAKQTKRGIINLGNDNSDRQSNFKQIRAASSTSRHDFPNSPFKSKTSLLLPPVALPSLSFVFFYITFIFFHIYTACKKFYKKIQQYNTISATKASFSNDTDPTKSSNNTANSSKTEATITNEKDKAPKKGFWDKLIEKHGQDTIRAPDDFNRWLMVPLAVSTHVCLGACYAWSLFNEPLTRELGVVGQVSGDWELGNVVVTFMGIIMAQGISMFLCGKWIERVGARITGVTGGILYGGGIILGSLG